MMTRKLLSKISTAAAALVMAVAIPGTASANLITFDESITGSNEPGSVGYSEFTVTTAGDVRIETFTNAFDPFLRVFIDDGSLDAADQIAFNDDGGTPSAFGFRNSRLVINLGVGSYIAAVGDYFMSTAEAVSGINDSGSLGVGSGAYALEVEGLGGAVVARVPAPGALGLLGLALAGLGLARRRG